MLDDGNYTAVLDRIEAEQAVLVLERDGRAVEDIVVDLDRLPADGRDPDTVLDVVVEDGDLVSATADPDQTDQRRARARSRFRRLARRLPRREEQSTETPVEDDSTTDTDRTPNEDHD